MKYIILAVMLYCCFMTVADAHYFSNFKFLDLPEKSEGASQLPANAPIMDETIVPVKVLYKKPSPGQNQRWNMRLFV
ncbi:hypothetical protein QR680_015914 [Steinernema hermaphroditum]|uniref:Uncharacterized protein n=1 Tax=Steinernema hermaphroditum TaxID=289476 RepID=A0AA39H9E1_9BILA|nr:hypothetical protein QR680_015914 [Steinernema hermaphroditum]